MSGNIVRSLGGEEIVTLERRLRRSAGVEMEEAPNAHFRARAGRAVLTAYESGKVVVQGGDARQMADEFLPVPGAGSGGAGAGPPRVGSDEAGKGDYLGPLVVAAVHVDARREEIVRTLGATDSKLMRGGRIGEVAGGIRAACPHAVVRVDPVRYNELRDEIGNLNHLLAWAHGKAIEEVLEDPEAEAERVVIDRFAGEEVIRGRLGERASALEVEIRPRAEDDAAVAAASVLARDAYDRRLDALGDEVGVALHAGAGPPAEKAAREVVRAGGREALARVAKLHFRTTDRVLRDA